MDSGGFGVDYIDGGQSAVALAGTGISERVRVGGFTWFNMYEAGTDPGELYPFMLSPGDPRLDDGERKIGQWTLGSIDVKRMLRAPVREDKLAVVFATKEAKPELMLTDRRLVLWVPGFHKEMGRLASIEARLSGDSKREVVAAHLPLDQIAGLEYLAHPVQAMVLLRAVFQIDDEVGHLRPALDAKGSQGVQIGSAIVDAIRARWASEPLSADGQRMWREAPVAEKVERVLLKKVTEYKFASPTYRIVGTPKVYATNDAAKPIAAELNAAAGLT